MQIEFIGLILGSSIVTSIVSSFLTKRKYKADVIRSEIENYQLVAKEWREAAQQWKNLADEYQVKLTEGSKDNLKLSNSYHELSKNYEALKKELAIVKGKLTKAYRRIEELERHDDNK